VGGARTSQGADAQQGERNVRVRHLTSEVVYNLRRANTARRFTRGLVQPCSSRANQDSLGCGTPVLLHLPLASAAGRRTHTAQILSRGQLQHTPGAARILTRLSPASRPGSTAGHRPELGCRVIRTGVLDGCSELKVLDLEMSSRRWLRDATNEESGPCRSVAAVVAEALNLGHLMCGPFVGA
jgi:hypothetical protein